MNRREWIKTSSLAATGLSLSSVINASVNLKKNPTIMWVSGWQTVNIGDVAHTPGTIALLKKYLPNANYILWPKDIGKEEEIMLKANFPNLRIVYGNIDNTGIPDNSDLLDAFKTADFFFHGSGPGLVAMDKLMAWKKITKKPYGIYGITIQEVPEDIRALYNEASFIFPRESLSVKVLNDSGITCKNIGFAPDATFNLSIFDDKKADAFIKLHELIDKKFLCVVPRLRYTPYHRIHNYLKWSPEKIQQVIDDNIKFAEIDHAKLREVIYQWVRETGNKVVLCPEMTYQTELFDQYLYNPLPADIKKNIVMHSYWLPDEASSLYKRSSAVVSIECHSPIIALTNHVPAFYIRQPSDTIKGQMYYDLGLQDWVFEIDKTTGSQISAKVLDVYKNPELAQNKISKLYELINRIQDERMIQFQNSII